MGRPSDPTTRRRIVAAAARLFAERGYAATTTRAIAAEVDANIATVHYHIGNKFEVFRAVLEDLYVEEMEILNRELQPLKDRRIRDVGELSTFLTGLADAMIDLMIARPERPRLYLRRWLDPEDEIRPLEVRVSLEVQRPLRELLEQAKLDGLIDPALPAETFLRSFMWLIFGYFVTGPIDWKGWFSDPLDPAHLAELRRLVHGFVHHGLEQPWPSAPAGRDRAQKY
jgi:AcrR family transcriptional regulator